MLKCIEHAETIRRVIFLLVYDNDVQMNVSQGILRLEIFASCEKSAAHKRLRLLFHQLNKKWPRRRITQRANDKSPLSSHQILGQSGLKGRRTSIDLSQSIILLFNIFRHSAMKLMSSQFFTNAAATFISFCIITPQCLQLSLLPKQ